ncbi:MAG: hypothetical protein Q9166_003040 [cf. Caloplaca sp. 2 TL-2023]
MTTTTCQTAPLPQPAFVVIVSEKNNDFFKTDADHDLVGWRPTICEANTKAEKAFIALFEQHLRPVLQHPAAFSSAFWGLMQVASQRLAVNPTLGFDISLKVGGRKYRVSVQEEDETCEWDDDWITDQVF